MGGLLHTTKDVVTRQMIEGMGGHFVWRGLAIPIDPFLQGTVRYGKKIGFELPIIAPDNKFLLADDAVYATDRVEVDRKVTWIDSGGYVTINRRELHRVSDVSDATIILATTLLADHPAGTKVFHYSDPIQVEGTYVATQTIINVDVTYFLVRGDVICVSATATQDISFVEYIITDLWYVGESGGLHQYQVVLDKPLHRRLTDGDIIQLRAYPAYISPVTKVPQAGTVLPVIGPYLVDWYSEPFIDDLDVQEYQTLQRFNDAQLPIGSPMLVEKNHQIVFAPIRADQFLWWTRVYGVVKYDDKLNKLIAEPDTDGYWWYRYACRPYIEVPSTNARGLIVTVPTAQLLNNDRFRLPDDVDAVLFEYKVDGTYVPTATAVATGSIEVTAFPTDNDTVTLDDGFGTVVTFEFWRTPGFVSTDPTYRVVDVQSATLFTDVAIALEQAINSVVALKITGDNVGAVLNLNNDVVSQLGNTTIVVAGVTAPAWLVVNFIGGTDPLVTIDVSGVTTALETAQLTAAAINRSDLHVNAQYPTISNATRIFSTVDGPTGNGLITELVADPNFIVQGMSGGTGGTSWTFSIKPEFAATLRVRLYPNAWQTYALPAGVVSHINVQLLPTDDAVERIDILIKSDAGSEIQMGDWSIRGAQVAALQHSYVAHVMGERNFASTGLFVKPLFHSIEDLRARFDAGDIFDSGDVRF